MRSKPVSTILPRCHKTPNVRWTLAPISILTQSPNHLKKLGGKRLFLQNLSLSAVDFYKQGHCELPSILKKNNGHICKMKTYYIMKPSFRLKLWNITNALKIFSSMFQPASNGPFSRVSSTSQEHFLHVISLPFNFSSFSFLKKGTSPWSIFLFSKVVPNTTSG